MKDGCMIKVFNNRETFGKGKNFRYFAAAGYLVLLGGFYYAYNFKFPSNYEEAKQMEEAILNASDN